MWGGRARQTCTMLQGVVVSVGREGEADMHYVTGSGGECGEGGRGRHALSISLQEKVRTALQDAAAEDRDHVRHATLPSNPLLFPTSFLIPLPSKPLTTNSPSFKPPFLLSSLLQTRFLLIPFLAPSFQPPFFLTPFFSTPFPSDSFLTPFFSTPTPSF